MGKNYLIDTNSILEFVSKSLPSNGHNFVEEVMNDAFNVSIINRIEVLGHPSATPQLIDFMNLANTFPITETIADQTITLRKIRKMKLPDALIAATALVYGLEIISRNTKDFQLIEGLNCINPHEL